MHCDYALRCAKITAINLGLRGRYGWVLCGNSLSGETQFAYRIGSFFNETPDGLRRGVIRDVPPEKTPVPVIAERMRRDAGSLFATSDKPETAPELTISTIIEVPPWLARLEPKLATLERDERAFVEEQSEQAGRTPDDPPARQQELF